MLTLPNAAKNPSENDEVDIDRLKNRIQVLSALVGLMLGLTH